MWKNLTEKAIGGAIKALQSDRAQRVLNNKDLHNAVERAVETGSKLRDDLAQARRMLAKRLDVATGDDLAELKKNLDRLERKVREAEQQPADTED